MKNVLRNTAGAWLLLAGPTAFAQVVTDGSLGPPTAIPGPAYAIGEELGTRAGNNLFHSFEQFSIAAGESAAFSGADSIQNLISRVTGGTPSEINGVLRSEVGQANFYFINPAGVLFGPEAVLDLPASLHVSTGQGLAFEDGRIFPASTAVPASGLSVAPPSAFGFIGPAGGGLRVEGAALVTAPGSEIHFDGAELSLEGAALYAPEGDIRLNAWGEAADGSPNGRILIGGSLVDNSGVASGSIQIRGGELVLVSSEIDHYNLGDADGAGSIRLEGGQAHLQNSVIYAQAQGGGAGAAIEIRLSGPLGLAGGSGIQTTAAGDGRAGDIGITAGEAVLFDEAWIGSLTVADGDAGALEIQTDGLWADGAGGGSTAIFSNALSGTGDAGPIRLNIAGPLVLIDGAEVSSGTWGAGNAGRIEVKAQSLYADEAGNSSFTGIASQTNSDSTGSAGTVEVQTTGRIELVEGGKISSSSFGSGAAGAVLVSGGALVIDKGNSERVTGIVSESRSTERQPGGAIEVSLDGALAIFEGGKISARTWSPGAGGTIHLEVAQLLIEGRGYPYQTGITTDTFGEGDGGAVTVQVRGPLELRSGGLVSSATFGAGNGGTLEVQAGSLVTDGEGYGLVTGLTTQAEPDSTGDAGAVHLQVSGAAHLQGDSGILSSANGSGDAGALALEIGGRLLIDSGAIISSTTFAEGDAGAIVLHADEIEIQGAGSGRLSGIITDSFHALGDAGEIALQANGGIRLSNGALISSRSDHAAGDGGSIRIEADALEILGQAAGVITGITTGVYSSEGDAGAIHIAVKGPIRMQGGYSAISSESNLSRGNAGQVEIVADSLWIDGAGSTDPSGVYTNQEGAIGRAGDIRISLASGLEIFDGAKISSGAGFFSSGGAGSVRIEAESVHIDGGDLPELTGIHSSVATGSAAESGDIQIRAGEIQLENGAGISIGSDGRAGPEAASHAIIIDAERVELESGARIDSSGFGGDPAADLRIRTAQGLILRDGALNTIALNADGGGIEIHGGPILFQNGGAFTSVYGAIGDGGDIRVQTTGLVLDSGAIQANTAAPDASGGDILIQIPALIIPEGQAFVRGGDADITVYKNSGINVIQAAAPDGVSGAVNLTTPTLDLSAAVAAIEAAVSPPPQVAKDPCAVSRGFAPSSLSWSSGRNHRLEFEAGACEAGPVP